MAVHRPVARIIGDKLQVQGLVAFGAYKARMTSGRPVPDGMELAAIGMASALVGYAVGLLFRVPAG